MLGNNAWPAVSDPFHPKGVGWGLGQDTLQASLVLPHITGKGMSLWTWLCALGW